jgi:hypothetical protein
MGFKLTALRSWREESDLVFFLAKFIGKLNDSIPGTLADGVAISIKIIYKVYLSSSIDSDLIPGTDAKSWVIARAIVHERFASGFVGLFIDSAGNGKLLLNTPRGK